jgi:plastocyanin
MKKLLAALAAACLVSAALLAIPALAATRTVTVKDDKFGPTSLTVTRGTTVTWVWRGHRLHNVAVTSGPSRFTSPSKTRGSFSRRLTKRGTYRLLCEFHPFMRMTVRVK